MKNRDNIIQEIQSIKEEKLREIIKMILDKAGMKSVRINHGTQEYGKDIVFYDEDKLNRKTWTACVVKINDIKQSSNVFDEVIKQIRECFDVEYDTLNEGKVSITEVIVITNGKYKPNVKTQINQADKKYKTHINYWDIDDLVDYIFEYKIEDIIIGEDISLNNYRQNINPKLRLHSNLKFLSSDFGIDVDELEELDLDIRAKAKKIEEERKSYLHDQSMKSLRRGNIIPNVDALLDKNKNILIQGTPTSGKTSTLKKIGKALLDKDTNSFVFFFELAKYCNESEFDIIKEIQKEYYKLSGFDFDIKKFKSNKVLILLDALDEVHECTLRDNVINEIESLTNEYDNIRVILTSRDNEYLSMNPKINMLFETYKLLPLDIKEMIKIGKSIIKSNDKIEEFIRLVKSNEIINSFPKTPLTTILLAILLKENRLNTKDLPKNITELYSKFTDIFLNKWDQSKGISEQYLFKQKEFVIQNIANYMHSNNMVTIKYDDLEKFLNDLPNHFTISELENVNKFIEDICNRSSIFIKLDDNSFKFFHLTIQEYLASGNFNSNDEELLISKFLNDWWLNPILFYIGRKPHEYSFIDMLAKLKIVPNDMYDKFIFVLHSTKILQSAHLLSPTYRLEMLRTMIKMFDSFLKDLISNINEIPIFKIDKTILDIILWTRSIFLDLFSSEQYNKELENIWKDDIIKNNVYTDIIEYCVSYRLAYNSKKSDYLYDFILSKENPNARWYKIIDVDVDIFKLEVPKSTRKTKSSFKSKALRNNKYIMQQFREKIAKHKNSISGL